ncbi:response regulator [Paenibacillus sp. FSL W8-0187]|uniref:response regulator n=1 Tax=Paenibacillus sp. FSL W8-0187 TaxID=2921710 RepID=UPI0030D8DA29
MSEVTILMVDDEIAIIKLMEIHVKNEGFTHSGQEALEIIRVQKVDLIILDVMMPHRILNYMTGLKTKDPKFTLSVNNKRDIMGVWMQKDQH